MEKMFVTSRDAAAFLCRSTSTLAKWRSKGFGPPYYDVDGRILYKMSDLEKFVESGRCQSTTDRKRHRGGRRRQRGPGT